MNANVRAAACSLLTCALLTVVVACTAYAADPVDVDDDKPQSDLRVQSAYYSHASVVTMAELILPASVTREDGCKGTVFAVVKRKGVVVGRKRLPIMSEALTNMHTCWISGKVPASGGKKGLFITIAFAGNDLMGPSKVSAKVAEKIPPAGS